MQDPKASMEDLAPSSSVGSWANGHGVVCVFPKEQDIANFFLNHSKSPREEEEMSGASFRPVSEDSESRVSGVALGILRQAGHGLPGGIWLQY